MHDLCHVAGDNIPEARELNMHIVPNYATKWRELGEEALASQLDIILVDHPNSCEERCKVMLQKWLRMDISATWGKLDDAARTLPSVHTDTTIGMVAVF